MGHTDNSEKRAISAGGVVVKAGKLLLIKFYTGTGVTFPKGHVEKGETYDQAALREVREETGFMDLELVKKLGVVTRPATERDGTQVTKTIHLFLFRITGESRCNAEEEIVWLSLEEALTQLLPQEADFLRSIQNEFSC